MSSRPFLSKMAPLAAVLALTMAAGIAAAESTEHRVVIYGWFPDIEGTLNYDIPGNGGSAGADASDLIDALEGVFMGAYEGRKGQWSAKVDLLYLDLANYEDNAVTIPIGGGLTGKVAAEQALTGWQVGLYGGYTVFEDDNLTLDMLGGLRYLQVDVDAELEITGPLPPTLPSKKLSESVELWDAVVGVKGQYAFNDKWYLPYHFDIGTGDSDLTWQAVAGVGYRFNWGSLMLAYRHLFYDTGDSGVIKDLEFSGPAAAVSFNF